jgi:hypothetical protein
LRRDEQANRALRRDEQAGKHCRTSQQASLTDDQEAGR